MKEIWNILIVEDDPMVAEINRKFTESVSGFHVVGQARNSEAAREFLENHKVDLIILDNYMPGESGIDFLRWLRNQSIMIDVIFITAANDRETWATAARLGVLDYLVKPFKIERYQKALHRFKNFQEKLTSSLEISQSELDSWSGMLSPNYKVDHGLFPKNIHPKTKEIIITHLKLNGGLLSADEVSQDTKVLRVTARRYLEYLVEKGKVEMVLEYLPIGRPVHRYRCRPNSL